ncbi:MAP1LC3A family protein [Megaselia abdita]
MISIDSSYSYNKMKYTNRCDINSNLTHFMTSGQKKLQDKEPIKSDEACAIRVLYPTKVPVIVERYNNESDLPTLNKKKFLVPQEITMSQFLTIIKKRLEIGPTKALFLLINSRTLAPLSKTLAEIYGEHRNTDGFLYITYSSQEVFG